MGCWGAAWGGSAGAGALAAAGPASEAVPMGSWMGAVGGDDAAVAGRIGTGEGAPAGNVVGAAGFVTGTVLAGGGTAVLVQEEGAAATRSLLYTWPLAVHLALLERKNTMNRL